MDNLTRLYKTHKITKTLYQIGQIHPQYVQNIFVQIQTKMCLMGQQPKLREITFSSADSTAYQQIFNFLDQDDYHPQHGKFITDAEIDALSQNLC
jgi:hypothetical protein